MEFTSTPSFSEFNPKSIPYQWQVIKEIRDFDYKQGLVEILLSGSVGSAKSLLMAHIAVYHVLANPGARLLLGRKALPDLKDTIFQKIVEHISNSAVEKYVVGVNYTSAKIQFANGSEIISRSWSDRKYKKMRSIELSAAVFEELTENDDDDQQAYQEAKFRIGRLPHIKENFFLSATNPDSPSHWVHKYFIENQSPSRKVFYSLTHDNPFLPPQYIDQLKRDTDPKLARRMLYGEWIEISTEVVYHAYDRSKNFRDEEYKVDLTKPIHLSWDFNIGEGKPLSLSVSQFDGLAFHFFDEVVVEGMRTEDSLEELAGKGILDLATVAGFEVHGDATGRRRDTRNIRSDYDIINRFLSNYKTKDGRGLKFVDMVPIGNPAIRKRHNLVNAMCQNAAGEIRLLVYKKAKTVDEGLRLTSLKKGGNYIEDDSKRFQHVTTAVGYDICATMLRTERKPTRMVVV